MDLQEIPTQSFIVIIGGHTKQRLSIILDYIKGHIQLVNLDESLIISPQNQSFKELNLVAHPLSDVSLTALDRILKYRFQIGPIWMDDDVGRDRLDLAFYILDECLDHIDVSIRKKLFYYTKHHKHGIILTIKETDYLFPSFVAQIDYLLLFKCNENIAKRLYHQYVSDLNPELVDQQHFLDLMAQLPDDQSSCLVVDKSRLDRIIMTTLIMPTQNLDLRH